jgi:phospholipid/cholesterol/gamma-HCH transport system ATP-binding protein
MNPTTDSHHTGVTVRIRDLHRSFHGKPVLQGIDLDVEPGEIFVVMGPSGSGKSVLLKHLIGLEHPDRGEILIDGTSIQDPCLPDKVRMAMVFQSGALLSSLTLAENVSLYLTEHRLKSREEIDRIVQEKLELVGLNEHRDRYPAELSGGMKKRAAIARALVIEPQLLLYDEPTSELDPQMAVVIAQEICDLNERTGATSIIVSHDRELAFGIANRIGLIHEGVILTSGTPDHVRGSTDPLVHDFLNASLKPSSRKASRHEKLP